MKKRTSYERKKLELEFWRNDPFEGGGKETLDSLVSKASEFEIFWEKINTYKSLFHTANRILEIGGGQLWASCIVKKWYPEKMVIGSDISQEAVAGSFIWERVFDVSLDDKFAFDVTKDEYTAIQYDLIFCFAAAHHFTNFDETFAGLKKILSPGGRIIFLHEPFSNLFFYKLALRRVNKLRPVVQEDLLQPHILKRAIKKNGLNYEIVRIPSTINRQGVASIYYLIFRKVYFLNFLFPTSVDVLVSSKTR